ncbi:hypothetical protein RUM43_006457 [Polyplax serrata]|uniref:Endonuclease/exonuclease/phosphatase domain-containing protein n=1 Tax=Polyplax serrata TaxID=468196 RepID=A0AAN8PYR3_POLSC
MGVFVCRFIPPVAIVTKSGRTREFKHMSTSRPARIAGKRRRSAPLSALSSPGSSNPGTPEKEIPVPEIFPGIPIAGVQALISSFKKGLHQHVAQMRETARYRTSINKQFLEGHDKFLGEFLLGLRGLLLESAKRSANQVTPSSILTSQNERFERLENALGALAGQVSTLTCQVTASGASAPKPASSRPQPTPALSTYAAAAKQSAKASLPAPKKTAASKQPTAKKQRAAKRPSVPAPSAFPALPKIPVLKPAPNPKAKTKPAPQPASYSAAIKAAAKRSIKDELQSALNPGTTGIKVLRLREGKTSISLTLADEASWTKVVSSTSLKARGLTASAPSLRQPRVAIYGVDRQLSKEQLVEVVRSQNFESVPMENIGETPAKATLSAWFMNPLPEVGPVHKGLKNLFKAQDSVSRGMCKTQCYTKRSSPPVCGNCLRLKRPADHDFELYQLNCRWSYSAWYADGIARASPLAVAIQEPPENSRSMDGYITLSPAHPNPDVLILRCLAYLLPVIRRLGSYPLLLCADANANSHRWFSRRTDVGGRLTEHFIGDSDLSVINRRSRLTTYINENGRKSNIDVTLASLSFGKFFRSWHLEDWAVSDHRTLVTTFSLPLPMRMTGQSLSLPGFGQTSRRESVGSWFGCGSGQILRKCRSPPIRRPAWTCPSGARWLSDPLSLDD